MSMPMVELNPSLQDLVDTRLDAVERVLLMANVSRGERRSILGELEAHVFELLGRQNANEPTRADVLAVLAGLDPPESYAPEGFDRRLLEPDWPASRRREPRLSLAAAGSAIVGAFLTLLVVASAILSGDGIVILLGALAILAVSESVGGYSLLRIYQSKGWLFGVRPALFAALLFPLLAINCVAALGLVEMYEIVEFVGIAIAFLTMNGALVYGAWRLCAAGIQPARRLA